MFYRSNVIAAAAVLVTVGAGAAVADADLIAQYTFEEGSGTTSANVAPGGSPATGTLVGAGSSFTTNTPGGASNSAYANDGTNGTLFDAGDNIRDL